MLVPASVSDYRLLARRRLPKAFFDYIDGGAYNELTLAANRNDLDALKLHQRVLRGASNSDTSTTVLGEQLAQPVILGPVGLAGLYARRGEGRDGCGPRGGDRDQGRRQADEDPASPDSEGQGDDGPA